MPDPKPPSTTKPITAPIFAISWHTSPSLLPKHAQAVVGGGGSAKTGVSNFIELVITCPINGEKKIKINTGDDVGVALDMFSFVSHEDKDKQIEIVTILLAVGIKDSVVLYRILVGNDDDDDDDNMDVGDGDGMDKTPKGADADCDDKNVQMVGSLDLGKDFLTNTVAFDALGGRIAVGGENCQVFVCTIKWEENNDNTSPNLSNETVTITKEMELDGHIKGICKVTCHPTNSNILLTSAKDATCRVWDLSKPPTDRLLDVLKCKIYDPNDIAKKKKIPNKILNPAPGQCLVKGCAFGDLQGTFIYTVQSGRRGNAFLSTWRFVRVPIKLEKDDKDGTAPSSQPPQQQQRQQPPAFKIAFQEQSRIKVAEFPISAVSLSGDMSTLALGDTNGTVMLYNTETYKKIKNWECIHDLPVTCIAARPLPLSLAGEDKTGIAIDAICASADSKMCYLTKQKRSTLKKVKKRKSGSGSKGVGGSTFNLTFLFMLISFIWACKVSYDVCSDEFVGLTSLGEIQSVMLECVVHTVWWAPQDRNGIAFVPT
jgi:WD40 repeat protein